MESYVNSLNNTRFIAGYLVRTDRSKSSFSRNGDRNCKSRYFNSINGERNLFQIFFKPKLKIEFDREQPALFKPKLGLFDENFKHMGILRKWLKIRIRNTGKATAINCRAKLVIIDSNATIRPYDTKRLIWDDLSSKMDIYPKDEGELCHVVFSDTDIESKNNPIVMISTEQAEKQPQITSQNSLGVGKHKIRIIVTAENEASISKTFNLLVTNDDFDLEEIA